MATDYSSQTPHEQLAKLQAEQPHVERLGEAGAMWEQAQERIHGARDDLLTRMTDLVLGSWKDDAGLAFGERVNESANSLKAWYEKIHGSGIVGHIRTLQADFPNCLAGVQAVCAQFELALRSQLGGSSIDAELLKREFSKLAAQFTNHIADLFDAVANALNALVGDISQWEGPRQEGNGEGQPGEGQPGEGQPGEGQPGQGQPGQGQPGEGQPGQGQPGQGQPGEGQPGQGQPGEGQPGEGQPGEQQPGEGDPQAPQDGELGNRIVENARGEVGTTEGAGYNDNPYGESTEWCSLFATQMWERSGVDTSGIENPAFTGNVYNWGVENGQAYDANNLSQARPGDVLLFGTGPESPDTSSHIGVVESVDPANGTVTLIEGNSGPNTDSVTGGNSYALSSDTFYGGVHPN